MECLKCCTRGETVARMALSALSERKRGKTMLERASIGRWGAEAEKTKPVFPSAMTPPLWFLAIHHSCKAGVFGVSRFARLSPEAGERDLVPVPFCK